MKNPRSDNKTPKKKTRIGNTDPRHHISLGYPRTSPHQYMLRYTLNFTTGSIFKHLKKTPLYKSEYVKIPVPGSLVHHFSDYFAIHCL